MLLLMGGWHIHNGLFGITVRNADGKPIRNRWGFVRRYMHYHKAETVVKAIRDSERKKSMLSHEPHRMLYQFWMDQRLFGLYYAADKLKREMEEDHAR